MAQAGAARDALARAIYNNLFDWIVDRVNISMKAKAPSAHVIGVLDIYGFEIFDVSRRLRPVLRASQLTKTAPPTDESIRAALHQLRQREATTDLHPADAQD